jgi:hypothetical protein
MVQRKKSGDNYRSGITIIYKYIYQEKVSEIDVRKEDEKEQLRSKLGRSSTNNSTNKTKVLKTLKNDLLSFNIWCRLHHSQ